METNMRLKLSLLATLACLGTGAVTTGASATPLHSLPLLTEPTAVNQTLAQPIGYRNYCGRWRHECGDRYPARGWRFRRCMSFHGCY
jgi:hypothetical protein